MSGDKDNIARKQCVLSSLEGSPSSSTSHSAKQNEEEYILLDDDMELSPTAQRELDLILERQNKGGRGQGEVDGECRTPPYQRAARSARATRAVPSSQGEECGGDVDPVATLATCHGI